MNKKIILGLFTAAGMTATGIMAATGAFTKLEMPSPVQDAPAMPAALAGDQQLIFYGSLEQSTAWTQTPAVGFYSFDVNDTKDPQAVSATQGVKLATGGGAYYDGHLYYINGSATYISITNDFMVLDVDQWKVVGGSSHSSPTKTDSYCMAYDYSTGTMYASSPDRSTNKLYLRKVDLNTGEFTNACELGNYYPAMAFDADGQLWAFRQEKDSYPQKVSLYKVDKNTGAGTFVGDIGYNQKSDYACAVFDYRTGKLYWSAVTYTYNTNYEETYVSYVCEVDTRTGKATPVKTFNNNEVFSILFFKDSHPKAPDAAGDIAFTTAADYTSGTIDFSVPTRCYDRSTLTGNVKAQIYVDGTLKQTLTGLAPGARAKSDRMTLPEGEHKVRIFLYNAAGNKSCPADFTAWSGADVPGKVTDIKVEVTPTGDKATVTWTAPTEGKTGGHFDSDNMTYRIVRRPDFTTVATGLKATTYTDTPDRVMKLSQYEIYAETPDGSSEPAYSDPVLVGKPYPITYLETFDTATAFNTYTLIDVNGVGSEYGDRWMWYPQYQCAIYWLNYDAYNAADAWLITPTLALEKDKVYRYSFISRGYSSLSDTYNLSAHVGPLPTQQAMKSPFLRINGVSEKEWTTHSALFLAEDGDCRIGLHLTSPGNDHCGIDNIRVAYYGPATIPGVPAVVSTDKNGSAARITVKAPDVDAKGRKISSLTKISLYRSDLKSPVTEISNPTPGKEIVIEDPSPKAGDNAYTITAANTDGEGLEAFADVNMLSPVPVAVEGLAHVLDATGNDVTLTWSYPQGYPAADGTTLKPSEIVYDVYRTIGGVKSQVARDVKSTSCTDANVAELFGGKRQERITYHVVARTTGGSAPETKTDVLAGRPYEMPVMVSEFFDMELTPAVSNPISAWSPGTAAYTPRASAAKGSTFMRCLDAGVGTQTWTLPRVNLTGLSKPTLSFQMYCSDTDAAATASLQIGIVVDKDGVEQSIKLLPTSYSCKSDATGWKQVVVDLSAYGSYSRASIVFVAHSSKQHNVYIDDLQITGEKVDRDMRVVSVSGPSSCIMARDNIYTAKVHNNGKLAIDGAIVTMSVDGVEVHTQKISAAADEEKEVCFTYSPGFADEDYAAHLKITVTAEGDGNRENDSESMRIEVLCPNVPYVDDLQGSYNPATEEVYLSWSDAVKYPRAYPVKENFDSYENFIIDGIGEWTVVDCDGASTIGAIQGAMGQFTWTNAGVPQAYIVFNPEKAGVEGLATAYSGAKCLVAFCAAKTNDDWLISPQLLGQEQTVSFFARAMNPSYPNESFEVLYSASGTDIADFTKMEGVVMNTAAWKKYEYTLPAGARYFAIRCTSNNQFGLMLDDIEYIPAQPAVDLTGYKVYRDGKTLAEPIGETEYVDAGIKSGESHTYHVSALYADGESIRSNAAVVMATGVESVAADGVKVFSADGHIDVIGADGMAVAVAAIDGKVLYNFKGTAADRVPVVSGVYIVTTGRASYKILVK